MFPRSTGYRKTLESALDLLRPTASPNTRFGGTQRMALATHNNAELAALDLFEASDYAVMARYDLQFWPDEETAGDAVALAISVRRIVLELTTEKPPDNTERDQK